MLSKAANTGILLHAKSSQAMQTNVSATAAHANKKAALAQSKAALFICTNQMLLYSERSVKRLKSVTVQSLSASFRNAATVFDESMM